MTKLIKLGADVNAQDLTQCTPLQNAAHGTYSALATMPANGSQGGASGVLLHLAFPHSASLMTDTTTPCKAVCFRNLLLGFSRDAWQAGGSSLCSSSVLVSKPFLLLVCQLICLISLQVLMQSVSLALCPQVRLITVGLRLVHPALCISSISHRLSRPPRQPSLPQLHTRTARSPCAQAWLGQP